MIEFIYAIVGIVWLTQYYTSCNDLTAKNVTLGMSAVSRAGRDGVSSERGKLRHIPREAVAGQMPGGVVAEAVGFFPGPACALRGTWCGGGVGSRGGLLGFSPGAPRSACSVLRVVLGVVAQHGTIRWPEARVGGCWASLLGPRSRLIGRQQCP